MENKNYPIFIFCLVVVTVILILISFSVMMKIWEMRTLIKC